MMRLFGEAMGRIVLDDDDVDVMGYPKIASEQRQTVLAQEDVVDE